MITTFQTDDHRQIVLGTLLGNGYICKSGNSSFFCIRHSIHHLAWLQSKAAELECYQSKTPWHKHGTTCTWRAASSPLFAELRAMCYPNGEKQVSMDWLNQLRALAIAVWYGDSGCLTGRNNKNASLRTQSYGEEGNQIIERYFNEVGMPCHLNKSRKSWIIVFTIEGTEIITSKVIAPFLPKNRYFKLAIPQTAILDLSDESPAPQVQEEQVLP